MSFILVHLGTDTSYTGTEKDLNDQSHPSRGCTLVELYKAIQARALYAPETQKLDPNFFQMESIGHSVLSTKAILDGPDTLGLKVYEVSAKSVMLTLSQIAHGHDNIIFFGHSRGSVITCVASQFLQLVQDVILQERDSSTSHQVASSPEQLVDKILIRQADDDKTICFIKSYLESNHKAHLISIVDGVRAHIKQTKISIFGFDPVPGGFNDIYGKTGWYTDAPYKLHDMVIVHRYEFYYQMHEVSLAFAAAMVKESDKGQIFGMYGNHATPQGSFGIQANPAHKPTGINARELKNFTPKVQEILLLKALAFLTRLDNEVEISSKSCADVVKPHMNFTTQKIGEIIDEFKKHPTNEKGFNNILKTKYDELFQTRKFFDQFKYNTYAYLGSLLRMPIEGYFFLKYQLINFAQQRHFLTAKNERLIISHASEDVGFLYTNLQSLHNSYDGAVNKEHFALIIEEMESKFNHSFEHDVDFKRMDKYQNLIFKMNQLIQFKQDSKDYPESLFKEIFKLYAHEILQGLMSNSIDKDGLKDVFETIVKLLKLQEDDITNILKEEIKSYFINRFQVKSFDNFDSFKTYDVLDENIDSSDAHKPIKDASYIEKLINQFEKRIHAYEALHERALNLYQFKIDLKKQDITLFDIEEERRLDEAYYSQEKKIFNSINELYDEIPWDTIDSIFSIENNPQNNILNDMQKLMKDFFAIEMECLKHRFDFIKRYRTNLECDHYEQSQPTLSLYLKTFIKELITTLENDLSIITEQKEPIEKIIYDIENVFASETSIRGNQDIRPESRRILEVDLTRAKTKQLQLDLKQNEIQAIINQMQQMVDSIETNSSQNELHHEDKAIDTTVQNHGTGQSKPVTKQVGFSSLFSIFSRSRTSEETSCDENNKQSKP